MVSLNFRLMKRYMYKQIKGQDMIKQFIYSKAKSIFPPGFVWFMTNFKEFCKYTLTIILKDLP